MKILFWYLKYKQMDHRDGMILQNSYCLEQENNVESDGLIIWILKLIENLGAIENNLGSFW